MFLMSLNLKAASKTNDPCIHIKMGGKEYPIKLTKMLK